MSGLLSIQAVHVPGRLNCGADMLSRGGTVHGEGRQHPQTVQMIWKSRGQFVHLGGEHTFPTVLFTDQFSHKRVSIIKLLAKEVQISLSPLQDHATGAGQDQEGKGDRDAVCTQNRPKRAGGTCGGSPVADSVTEGPAVSNDGHYMAPQARTMGPACLITQCERHNECRTKCLGYDCGSESPVNQTPLRLESFLTACAVSVFLSLLLFG